MNQSGTFRQTERARTQRAGRPSIAGDAAERLAAIGEVQDQAAALAHERDQRLLREERARVQDEKRIGLIRDALRDGSEKALIQARVALEIPDAEIAKGLERIDEYMTPIVSAGEMTSEEVAEAGEPVIHEIVAASGAEGVALRRNFMLRKLRLPSPDEKPVEPTPGTAAMERTRLAFQRRQPPPTAGQHTNVE